MKNHLLPLVWMMCTTVLLGATAPADADRLLQESRDALKAKDAKRAVELAEQAVGADSDRSDLHENLGHAYATRIGEVNFMHQAMMSGKMRGAYERAIELDPNNLGARIGLARYFTYAPAIAGGSRGKAEAEAEEIKRRHPFLGAFEFGAIAQHFDDPKAAIAAYAEAAALEPEKADVHERLGAMHEKLEQRAEARACYEKALALEPTRTQAKAALARLAAAE